eukprot:gnl/Chilomastix_cuspidata/780.p1 GENE.gnl/Chilomastix_cuspidata/780~~gnl/Chilomastix_cuspidata/780.p1  ORF type:complete len:528 (+),score=273.14 gnl/Chilomastix_cuspidata/780:822-2405(+)
MLVCAPRRDHGVQIGGLVRTEPRRAFSMREEIERAIHAELGARAACTTEELATKLGAAHEDVVGAAKSLFSSDIIAMQAQKSTVWELTAEGARYASEGSPEFQALQMVLPDGAPKKAIQQALGRVSGPAVGLLVRSGHVRVDKRDGEVFLVPTEGAAAAQDEVSAQLTALGAGNTLPAAATAQLKRRKLVTSRLVTTFTLTRGEFFGDFGRKQEAVLTADLLAGDRWREVAFKPYKLSAGGKLPAFGCLHPLMVVRATYREIFLGMGFEEMETDRWVESSFWNFDALIQPQAHPARDMHDTFFTRAPHAATREVPAEYEQLVRAQHEAGGFGSIGYRYDWSPSEARKNILRTHTTAVSARVLQRLGEELQRTGTFRPRRFFSIDRVFRNETLDMTHLAEFHQVEGLVCDRGLTLGHLIGVIREFFAQLGITELRFKPAYNPYTEPSMEIFAFHKGLAKWVEVGNSGMFRPEMLRPMGFPPDVHVIAWGLSLERPTMIKYGIKNIRELFGHGVSLDLIQRLPVCKQDA